MDPKRAISRPKGQPAAARRTGSDARRLVVSYSFAYPLNLGGLPIEMFSQPD